MLHFCVKIIAQKDWIMSKVLLSIFTLIIQENAPVTQLQQIISQDLKKNREKQLYFLKIYIKNIPWGIQKIQGAGDFFQK